MDTIHSAPPPALERPRVVAVGTGLACTAIVLYFAGLIGIYLAQRAAALASAEGVWLQDISIPLRPANTMLVTMLMSLVTVQWAVYALNRNDRVNTYLASGLTLLFGGAVINSQYWMYTQMNVGVADSTQALFIYVLTGSFLALLGSAMAFLAVVSLRTLAGEYGPHQTDAPAAAAVYWYVTVGAFVAVWYALYFTK